MGIDIGKEVHIKFNELDFGPVENGQINIGVRKTGKYIKIPAIGKEIIILLINGYTIGEAEGLIKRSTGEDVNITIFIDKLENLGFIRTEDEDVESSFQTKERVPEVYYSFYKNRLFHAMVLIVALFCYIEIFSTKSIFHLSTYFWSESILVTVIGNTLIMWTIMMLHEFGHVMAAKSVGVHPAIRVTISTFPPRMSTYFSNIWGVSKKERIFVYYGGVPMELMIGILCYFLFLLANHYNLTNLDKIVKVTVLTLVLTFISQLQLRFKTDLLLILNEYLKIPKIQEKSIGGFTLVHWVIFLFQHGLGLVFIVGVYIYAYQDIRAGIDTSNSWLIFSGFGASVIQFLLSAPFLKGVFLWKHK